MPRLKTVTIAPPSRGNVIEERVFMFDVDREKAFRKLAEKQFKEPRLAFREIVSNALDAYRETDIERVIEIELSRTHYSCTDWGRGFSEEQVECLRTLGRSEKRGEEGFIGRFGIGFSSLFHPDLGLKEVIIDAQINDGYERLEFKVEPEGVQLKRYKLEGKRDFSTRVWASFDGLEGKELKETEEMLEREAKYINAYITLNRAQIGGTAFLHQTRKYMMEFTGDITGRLCFFDANSDLEQYTPEKLVLLSHGIHIKTEPTYMLDPSQRRRGKPQFGFPAMFGYVNCDRLNVITSRSDFRKDEIYQQFMRDVKKQARSYFREMCAELNRTGEEELRNIVYEAFKENYGSLASLPLEEHTDACLKAVAQAEVFTTFNQRGRYSYEQLHAIGKKQGYLLRAENAESVELFEMMGYQPPIVQAAHHLCFNDIKVYDLDKLSFRGNMDEEFYQKLVDEGIIDPAKLERKSQVIPDADLAEEELQFIHNLRGLIELPGVNEVFQRHGLSEQHTIHIADIMPEGIAACYSPSNQLLVNRKNACSREFVESGKPDAAMFYLPILAHELSHNVVTKHNNPFYELSSQLSSELVTPIADHVMGVSA
jgi:hypothetical protein